MEIKCFHNLEMWSRNKELYSKLNIFTCNLYLVGSFLCLIFSNCWPCLPKEQAAEYSSQKQVHSNFHFRILSHKLSFFLCPCFCCLFRRSMSDSRQCHYIVVHLCSVLNHTPLLYIIWSAYWELFVLGTFSLVMLHKNHNDGALTFT